MANISNRSRYQSNLSGFTLIELLVVISIISLLLAILLPVLSKSRDAAKTIICLNHFRQIGLTTAVYTTEHNSNYPISMSTVSGGDYGNGLKTWQSLLYPYLQSNASGYIDARGPEVLNFPTYICPELVEVNDYQLNIMAFGYSANIHFFGMDLAAYSGTILDIPPRSSPPRKSVVTHAETGVSPSRPFGVAMRYTSNSVFSDNDAAWEACMAMSRRRHSNSTNILWEDGHAQNQPDAVDQAHLEPD